MFVGLISCDFCLVIIVLVFGCFGVLVIGVFVLNVVGIGNGVKWGILVKGGEVMDIFFKIDIFVFDKIGILIKGIIVVFIIKNYIEDEGDSLVLVVWLEMLFDYFLGCVVIYYV